MLFFSIIITMAGIAIGIRTFHNIHKHKKSLTLKRISLPIFFCCLGLWVFAYHIYNKDVQRITNLKMILSTNTKVKFFTEKDDSVKTIDSIAKDTSIVYSSGKAYNINVIRIAN